jgi:DNA-binding transcriptional LysR family regulator
LKLVGPYQFLVGLMEGSMDRFEAMSTLLAVVDSGSFSAASRQLKRPLTTVSRKVADLEKLLNAQLLTRTGRKLVLTDAGRVFVASSRRILDDLREAERSAAGEFQELKGELVITAPNTLGRMVLVPIVADFLRAHPHLNVKLALADRYSNLVDEHIDLAVRIGHLPDSDLIASHVGATRRVFCASPDYLSERGIPQHPDELRGHHCVTIGGLFSPEEWPFRIVGADKLVTVQSRLVAGTVDAALTAASAGVGIVGGLGYFVAPYLRAGAVNLVLERFEPPALPINLVYVAGRFLPQRLRAFCDFAAPRLRKALAADEIL